MSKQVIIKSGLRQIMERRVEVKMKVTQTKIPGLLIIEPDVFRDERGYFFESFNQKRYQKAGLLEEFVQDNQSQSQKNTLRGLHYQVGENAQGKLVRVIHGRIRDVAVDIRFGSPTFGMHEAVELSSDNFLQLWIPKGFAHGFSAFEENTIVEYKCTGFYSSQNERGILYNDPDLSIDWKVKNPLVSEKDRNNSLFKDIAKDFFYK